MYTFNPMTEDDINNLSTFTVTVLEPGIYDFEVLTSTRKISKKGNDMAEISINVWDKQGKTHRLFDYLVFSPAYLSMRKIKNFCEATGLHQEYKRGQLSEDLQQLSGKVLIDVQEPQPKEGGGFYPKRNIVVDYVVPDKMPIANHHHKNTVKANYNNVVSDDVPF